MKVYVDELPQTIGKAKIEGDVNLTEVRMWFETEEEIEVKLLSDHDKQVRKQVCDEIRKEFEKHTFCWYEDEENVNEDLFIDIDWVWEVLDQIEKGK